MCGKELYNFKFLILNFRRAGFTLIEIIIVMLIIGLAIGLSGGIIYFGKSGLELNTFVKDVSATLRYARSHAVAEKKVYTFILLPDKRAYALNAEVLDVEEADETVFPAIRLQQIAYKTIPDALNVALRDRADENAIDFFPQGNSSGGIIEIKGSGDKMFTIIINKITGRVEVKKVQNGK